MKSKAAQSLYALGTIITGIVSVALIWGGISAESAAGITQAISGLLVLLGGTAVTTTAGVRVTKQRADGTLDSSPVDQVLAGLDQIATARDRAAADFDAVTKAAVDTIGAVPGVGPVAGSLSQQILDGLRR